MSLPAYMTDAAARPELDAVTLEIILSGLRSIADETYIALMKSAFSTNIKERNDHSTALIDIHGRMLCLCEKSQPIHLSSMLGLTGALLRKYPLEAFRPGDIFIANDPYVADGSHLPDVNFSMPVFVDGKLICFMCNIAHHADIGGMAPGSMSGGMTEIYQEGLRIPPVRLFSGYELQQDILDLVLLNARVPDERHGDYNAQIAACRLGERRVHELAAQHGLAALEAAFAQILARSYGRMIRAIEQVPPGSYVFEDVMDDDGFGAINMPIRLRVTVGDPADEGRIRCDFTGSHPMVRGNINVPYRALQSSVVYAMRALLDPNIPSNQGMLDAIDIVAPAGSMLHATFPAAVAGRANTCQRVIDVVLGALAPALPDRAVGAANGANTMVVFAGRDAQTGKDYVYLETVGGGFGGRAGKDGKDGVQVHLINTSNLPVEAIETEYPLLAEAYEFVEDSGGAGRHRGGLGLRRTIRPVGHTAQFTGQGERFLNAPWGIFGGTEGGRGRFYMQDGEGRQDLPTKPGLTPVTPDQSITVETAGAGGYGAPQARSPQSVQADLSSGKYTPDYLARHYPQFEEP
ncbi:hydantoinase B/oxoprolinase family protein [Propylenella binzhouense]|uniref:Hydantoinase B/oxoprolinase family protein n=1 Tax=Propylenella binzhouense TaxID=2555902 RepID=A0A964WRW5_9HYPH|nr:hydantoinase B/oxoprolinase family protein [Propylenella binzhouense]MYZ46220.1 hydantoinase B/oxoprolinase family protein [Propylenella binzhouense]